MMVLLKDRQCQVPSLRASKWEKDFYFFCISRELRRKSILNPQLNSVIIFSFLENSDMDKNSPLEKKSPMEKQFRSWIKFRFCKQILILKNKF